MWWRSSSAALTAGCMAQWPYLPRWHKAWIIATVEEDIEIKNSLLPETKKPKSPKRSGRKRR